MKKKTKNVWVILDNRDIYLSNFEAKEDAEKLAHPTDKVVPATITYEVPKKPTR